MLRMTLTLLPALLLAGAWPTRFTGETEDNQGRADYIEMGCYQCHGYQGQGGAGPRIAPDPLDFETFTEAVRRPFEVMPAYSPAVLGDEKLERIYQYMESIPQPPELSTLPFEKPRR